MKTETSPDEHCPLCGSKHCQCRLGRHDKYGHSLNRNACTPREADAQGEQRRRDRADCEDYDWRRGFEYAPDPEDEP